MSDAPKPKVVHVRWFSPFYEHRTMADVAMMQRARLGEPWETLGALFYPKADDPADTARKTFWKHATAEDAAARSRSRRRPRQPKPKASEPEWFTEEMADETTAAETASPWSGMGACFA